ncbi:ABC transporter ATP-binding protein [Actinosynnema sp. NPDC020468]|uniref:ABC transporter ATP-binding protein n=1 Tax=Actinosynnema sp. NPDC020468 TaxID=3154488 RepID=UPI0033C9FDF8
MVRDGGALLELDGVGVAYPGGVRALEPVTASVSAGEFVGVVGPSGCGKSTLLRAAAGLVAPTSGRVVRHTDDLAYVFQEPTLMPWRTVRRNVELVAELRGVRKVERRERAAAMLGRVGLADFADHLPAALSGGMRMRAALAQALVMRPRFFLFDEPFSALDELTRERLADELLALHRADGFGAVFVTHSVAEAVYLSTRVLVLSARPGRVVADLDVPFGRDREPGLRYTPEFAALVARATGALRAQAGELS